GTSLPLDYERILSKFRKYYLQKIPLETKVKASLDLYFTMTTEENDSRYILTAYTSVTMFYKILNKHLATYMLHYFDSTLYKTQDYTFSSCIIDLISLIIHSKELEPY
ncbi:unnamed protein product, partial [Didymodactylos carnosus]